MKHAEWCNLISLSIADSLSLPKDYNKKNDPKPEEEATADTDEEEKQHLNGIFSFFRFCKNAEYLLIKHCYRARRNSPQIR